MKHELLSHQSCDGTNVVLAFHFSFSGSTASCIQCLTLKVRVTQVARYCCYYVEQTVLNALLDWIISFVIFAFT